MSYGSKTTSSPRRRSRWPRCAGSRSGPAARRPQLIASPMGGSRRTPSPPCRTGHGHHTGGSLSGRRMAGRCPDRTARPVAPGPGCRAGHRVRTGGLTRRRNPGETDFPDRAHLRLTERATARSTEATRCGAPWSPAFSCCRRWPYTTWRGCCRNRHGSAYTTGWLHRSSSPGVRVRVIRRGSRPASLSSCSSDTGRSRGTARRCPSP